MKSLWLRTLSTLSTFFLKVEANSYIRHFWKSENGKLAQQEMGQLQQVHATVDTRIMLMNEWLPNPKTLSNYKLSICYLHELKENQLRVQLFDSPFYIAYAQYMWKGRTQREMKLKALVALSLSGQLKELQNETLKIVIIDQESAIDGSHGIAHFQVLKVSDLDGAYLHEEVPGPVVLEPLPVN